MPLEEVRIARQMTQAKLADAAGVNQGEISRIERRTNIYLSTLAALEIRGVFLTGRCGLRL